MPVLKRTYALPRETVERFERAVRPGRRSATIAGALRAWMDHRTRERLRAEVVEGCREMADVYLDIERAYHPLEEETHRALAAPPPARRRRPRPARSGRRI